MRYSSFQYGVAVAGNAEFWRILHLFDCAEHVLERREEGIAWDFAFDEGKIEVGAEGQGLFVDLSAAANEDFTCFAIGVDFAQVADGLHAGAGEEASSQDEGSAVGQRAADGLKGFAAHNKDVAGGHLFEPLKIFRQVPGDFVAVADHAIERHGRDGLEMFHGSIKPRFQMLRSEISPRLLRIPKGTRG
jgi:hypothetical protein